MLLLAQVARHLLDAKGFLRCIVLRMQSAWLPTTRRHLTGGPLRAKHGSICERVQLFALRRLVIVETDYDRLSLFLDRESYGLVAASLVADVISARGLVCFVLPLDDRLIERELLSLTSILGPGDAGGFLTTSDKLSLLLLDQIRRRIVRLFDLH